MTNPIDTLKTLRTERDEIASLISMARDQETVDSLESQVADLDDRIYFLEYKIEDWASD